MMWTHEFIRMTRPLWSATMAGARAIPSMLCVVACTACLAWVPAASGLAFQETSESAQDTQEDAQEDADQKLLDKWLIWMRPDFRPDAPPVLVDPEVVRDSRLKDRSRETAPALKLELPPLEKPTEDADPQD